MIRFAIIGSDGHTLALSNSVADAARVAFSIRWADGRYYYTLPGYEENTFVWTYSDEWEAGEREKDFSRELLRHARRYSFGLYEVVGEGRL
jgi:hypothetical protein